MDKLIAKVNGGNIVATLSTDPEYPGIDIEFVSDDDKGESMSRPRVLFEQTDSERIRALICENKNSEDFTTEIDFDL